MCNEYRPGKMRCLLGQGGVPHPLSLLITVSPETTKRVSSWVKCYLKRPAMHSQITMFAAQSLLRARVLLRDAGSPLKTELGERGWRPSSSLTWQE